MRIGAMVACLGMCAAGAAGAQRSGPLHPADFGAGGMTVAGDSSPLPAEGTQLVRQPGVFREIDETNRWQFVPESDASIRSPLTVLPNSQLAALQQRAREKQDDTKLAVTGVVTRYQQGAYLLVQSVAPTDAKLASEKIAPATSGAPATRPGSLPADQMLNQMLQPTGGPRPLQVAAAAPMPDATSGAAAVAPGAAQVTVMREGSFLVDRTGRLTRAADGQSWEFTLESDARAMKDPPLIILPNLKLMTMEQAVKNSTRDLRFRITGMVTEYGGRNYVLLEKVVVVPENTAGL